ncbi:MAG: hypothetical protein HRT53_16675 [Colwellia sp.]|nr:hypothetical protein [Colwellia sp.]
MALKADLRHFLDEEGNEIELTDQAKAIFRFLVKIVSAVSENIDQPLIYVDLQCRTRADDVSCRGSIEATYIAIGNIEWHCDTCEVSGTISHWQGSMWDKQKRILH